MSITEDLAQIARQERELQLPRFDAEVAWRFGSALHATAFARALSVVIDIRRWEQQLFFTALPGTTPDNADWVRRKINTVRHFSRSSYAIGLELQAKNSDLTEKYALPARDYAAHGGCFPLAVAGAGIVGAITVSGLPQREDHELIVEALCAELGRGYAQLRLAPAM